MRRVLTAIAVVAVIGVSILLFRAFIRRDAESDETRRTIAAWLAHDDPMGAHPRDSTIVIDSLQTANILNETAGGGPARVLVDVTYHVEAPNGRRGPFHRSLRLVHRRQGWQVEAYQTIDTNDIPLSHRVQEEPPEPRPADGSGSR